MLTSGALIRLEVPKNKPTPSCADREKKFGFTSKEISDKVKKSILLSRQYSSQKDRKKMWPARVQHASIFLPFPSIILKMNGSQYQPVVPPLPSLRAVKQNFLLQSHYHVSPEEET